MSLWNPTPEELAAGREAMKDVKFKDMTKEETKAAIRDIEKEHRRKREACPYTARVGVCVFCKNKVTETFSKVFDPSSGPLIIGPGSRSQFHWQSSGLSCVECGLMYKKLPKKDDPPIGEPGT